MKNLLIVLIGTLFLIINPNTPKITDTSKKFNKYTWLLAHNAHMSKNYRYSLYIRQDLSIPELLEFGVRAINLDIFPCEDKTKICLCHSSCSNDGYNGPLEKELPFEIVFNEIGEFLLKNTNEVVTLIFEDYVTDTTAYENFFKNSQYFNMIMDISAVDTKTDSWPTLDWMITNNKRILIFTDEERNSNNVFSFNLWKYSVENTFDISGDNFEKCIKRDSSQELTTAGANGTDPYKLFVFNHISAFNFFPASIGNSNEDIVDRWVEYCKVLGVPKPNYLMMDYIERGNTLNSADVFISENYPPASIQKFIIVNIIFLILY